MTVLAAARGEIMSKFSYLYTTVRRLLESELELRNNSGTNSQTEMLPLLAKQQRQRDVYWPSLDVAEDK